MMTLIIEPTLQVLITSRVLKHGFIVQIILISNEPRRNHDDMWGLM